MKHSSGRCEIYAMLAWGENDRFFMQAYAGMAAAAAALGPNLRIERHGPPDWNSQQQSTILHTLLSRKPAGLIVSAAHSTALNPLIADATDAGIPVITFDGDAPDSRRLSHVGTDNHHAGYLAGQALLNCLHTGDDLALISVRDAAHHEERIRGFRAAVADIAPEKNVYVLYDAPQGEESTIQEQWENVYTSHPEIRGLWLAHGGRTNTLLLHALSELQKPTPFYVLSVDFDEDTLPLMLQHTLHATIGQDPYMMGYTALLLAHYARHAEQMPVRQELSWQKAALTDFLQNHPSLPQSIQEKLHAQVDAVQESSHGLILSKAKLLGQAELCRELSAHFGTLCDAAQHSMTSLDTARDECERLHEALGSEKRLLRLVVDTMPDFIYVKDAESRFILANTVTTHAMGASSPEELVGKSDADFFPEELAKTYYDDEQALIKSDTPLIDREEPVIDQKSGRPGWLLTTKVPFHDREGRVAGFVGIGRNITKRKEAEKAVKKANEELELRIAHLRHLMGQVMKAARQLVQASGAMTQISAQLASASEETSQQIGVVSSNSLHISQSINDISAVAVEVAANIAEISRNTDNVAQNTLKAVEASTLAKQSLQQLTESSGEIHAIITFISGISEQTRFLALNATIEAARAGDFGAGFKVVADEVKELAQETALAAKNISKKLSAIHSDSNNASLALAKVGEIIEHVSLLASTISAAIVQQSQATTEISQKMTSAAHGSEEISRAITEVSAAANDSSEQAIRVQDEAQKLAMLADQLQELFKR